MRDPYIDPHHCVWTASAAIASPRFAQLFAPFFGRQPPHLGQSRSRRPRKPVANLQRRALSIMPVNDGSALLRHRSQTEQLPTPTAGRSKNFSDPASTGDCSFLKGECGVIVVQLAMGFEIDFLPVGDGTKSGDAIALRFGNLHREPADQAVVIIDGGTLEAGQRLVNHVKHFYKTRSVDLVISTHPDGDHASGLRVVLRDLRVGELLLHRPWNHTDDIARLFKDGRVTDNSVREALRTSLTAARDLETIALKRRITIVEPFTGLVRTSSYGGLTVLGPTESFYESLLLEFRSTPTPATPELEKAMEGLVRYVESWESEMLDEKSQTSAENNTSAIVSFESDQRAVLFTADAGTAALNPALDLVGAALPNLFELVQVPHHGSKQNVSPTLLNRLLGTKLPLSNRGERRATAFVSAAKAGKPNHPSALVTNAFARRGVPVHATQGGIKRYTYDAPPTTGWESSSPLPFYSETDS